MKKWLSSNVPKVNHSHTEATLMPSSNTADLKKFAAAARRQLREQVAGRLEQVLRTDSAELRERETALKELRAQVAQTSKKEVIDRVAYTWFNRFCALRFMDVNRYTRLGIVSPAEGLSQPEVLQEAKQGYIDDDLNRFVEPQRVFDLLNGQRPSTDPQGESYRLLLVAACNYYGEVMPFLFEKIAGYTELLMPLDLLSEHAVLHGLREALTAEACQDVEVIGWLYQYYIAERKDEVFEALKQNQKIEAGDIPAATQLFTPHWIVRYLVENSLGRLWLLNKPNSRLAEKMEFYIRPAQEETDFLRIASPEEIRLADPACGSGHMLTYAFDLLYAIYEEEGYPATDIPRLILEKNLYGIEIDGRAGALAAFALFMKARAKDRRWFARPAQPQICVLKNVSFTDQELDEYMRAVGRDLFTAPLKETLRQFEQAENFGSLIRPLIGDVSFVRGMLEDKQPGLFLHHIHEKALKVLSFAEFLSPRYQVVVTNPPYMGTGNLNDDLKDFAINYYGASKFDLYAMFIEMIPKIVLGHGFIGMITMQSWMFISSYEQLRQEILLNKTILTMAHLGAHAFDSIGGEVVSTTAFIAQNTKHPDWKGKYFRLIEGNNEAEKAEMLRQKQHLFEASSDDFKCISGSPITYWVSKKFRELFSIFEKVDNRAVKGLDTGGKIDLFLRRWFEISFNEFSQNNKKSDHWYPIAKGGKYRKWYGNHEHVLNYKNSGEALQKNKANLRNKDKYFLPGLTWTVVSSSDFAVRFLAPGFLFDQGGCAIFRLPNDPYTIEALLGFLNSKIIKKVSDVLCPTLNFTTGDVRKFIIGKERTIEKNVEICLALSKKDWDSFEISWDFSTLPLIKQSDTLPRKLESNYKNLQNQWLEITEKMKQLEEYNNGILINVSGLQDELTPEVQLEEITLTCNPRYRYGGHRSNEELEALLKADTMKEFISYAVGCMFGRYSLEKPGLVLANAGETLQDYLRQVPEPTFMPDEDNAIPVLDGEWFSDDITERFKKFLHVTFGDEHYDENLAFIEDAIGRDLRSYFVKEFYKEHVSMYKKRPIYWMFSSPKGSFNVLMYMHRYKPDTISVILNRYLREFRAKLEARKSYLEQVSISGSAQAREKTSALKEIEKLNATLEELRVYEREVLYPLATQRLEIDLDDGVKANYPKFGSALVKIVGL